MLVYRIDNQLWLSKIVEGVREITMIYDGNQGPPVQFYVYTEAASIIIVLILPGIVLINNGDYLEVKHGTWLSFETNRDDDPISYSLNIHKNLVVKLLYSDLTYIIIDNGNLTHYDNHSRQIIRLIDQGKINLPVRNLYGGGSSFTVTDPHNQDIYMITIGGHHPMIATLVDRIDENERPERISKVIEVNRSRYSLYEDGHLILGEREYENIKKIFVYQRILLTHDGILSLLDHESGEVWFTTNDVDNFYFDEDEAELYFIREDQLICRHDNEDDNEEIIIVRGASGVRFTTNTYYDTVLNTRRIVAKSARK